MKETGQKLWKDILSRYDLQHHEIVLLEQACRTADICADLQAHISRDGAMSAGAKAGRVRPAVVELRQQRLALARMLVGLRVPLGDQETDASKTGAPRLQRRGLRGVYELGRVS